LRKGFAIGTASIMVLMSLMALSPGAAATIDGISDTPPTPEVNCYVPDYTPVGTLGSCFSLGFVVYNPLDHYITMINTLPPSYRPYYPEDTGVWTVPPGSSSYLLLVILDSVGPVSHWETNTVQLFDGETLLDSDEDNIWVEAFDGFAKDAVLLDESIQLDTEVHWLFEITVSFTEQWYWDNGLYHIVVTDSFGPGFAIHDSNPLTPEFDPYEMTHGTFAYTTNGNTEIVWTVGDIITLGEEARLVLELSHEGFSEPGVYQLNDGALLTFDRYIPCTTYVQHTAETGLLLVTAPSGWGLRTIGFWKHQFNCALGNKKNAYQHVPTEFLEAYLAEMSATSTVPELQDTDTLEEALAILKTKNNADMYDKTVTQLLAAWMNYLSGSEMWDSDDNGWPETPIIDTIMEAEAGLLDGDPDNDEEFKDTLDMLNNSGEE
jgi:hypothetical protein